MSKGYPDYFGASIWPKYGTMIVDADTHFFNDDIENDIFAITGPGVWSYGRLSISAEGAVLWGTIRVYVDLEMLIEVSTQDYLNGTYIGMEHSILKPYYVDGLTYAVKVSLTHDVPFHDSVRVTFERLFGAAIYGAQYANGFYRVL